LDNLDDKFVKIILENCQWKFAKTMASYNPHNYTLKSKWNDPVLFENIVNYIQQNGISELFKYKHYTQLYLGEFKYWTMGEPVKQTILINRKPKNIL
tara:strand:+ start:1052 stop:1342 length:291 start_codon:yes stop_codon:yes gene_type:complete